jgi:hypothetical protein
MEFEGISIVLQKKGQGTHSTIVLRSLIAQLAWSRVGSKVDDSLKALHGGGAEREKILGLEELSATGKSGTQ